MGQKVNPIGLRLGINRTWDSPLVRRRRDYAKLLHEDLKLRKYAAQAPAAGRRVAGSSSSVRRRSARVTIHTARPGVVIGKKGADIEKLRNDLAEDDRAARCT